jgi:3-oxoacyl-[acyl-carrier protein] reductase
MFSMLTGKTIIVTGASRGIGRAIAVLCAREGATVGINYLQSEQSAIELCDDLNRRREGSAFLLPFDVRNSSSISDACDALINRKVAIHGWVNNAGIQLQGLLLSQTDFMIEQQIQTNLVGTIYCCRYAIPHMMERRSGSIINVGSVTNSRVTSGQAVYAATKGALAALTRALAREYGRKGIRVNCVDPGPVDTEMFRQTQELAGEEIRRQIPLSRLGTPEDIAEVVTFLLSDRASFLTGGIFTADGGFSL